MGVCSVSARFLMIALSILFWAFSAGCLFVAIELFRFMGPLNGEIIDKMVLLAPGGIMIVLAILLFAAGMIGMCGACQESNCLKGTFGVLLLVIIGIEVAGVVFGVINKDEVKVGLEKSLKKALKNYEGSPSITEAVDALQQTLECCGVTLYSDWFSTPWGRDHLLFVPTSCCKADKRSVCTGSPVDIAAKWINTQGCNPKLYDDIQTYLVIIIAVAVVFALIQFIGLVCTCALLFNKKRQVPYQSLSTESSSANGYRA